MCDRHFHRAKHAKAVRGVAFGAGMALARHADVSSRVARPGIGPGLPRQCGDGTIASGIGRGLGPRTFLETPILPMHRFHDMARIGFHTRRRFFLPGSATHRCLHCSSHQTRRMNLRSFRNTSPLTRLLVAGQNREAPLERSYLVPSCSPVVRLHGCSKRRERKHDQRTRRGHHVERQRSGLQQTAQRC